jgi:hypothetical protein
MPHTNRPLMGNANVVPNPEVVQAQSPHSMSVTDQGPGAQPGTPDSMAPEAPTHNWEKRYKDLQSYSTKQMNDKETEIANLLRDKAQGPAFQVPKTADELAAFQKANPETHAFIQTIAHDIANNQTQIINDRLEHAESALATTSRETAMSQLKQAHPDFEEINGHPSFNDWLSTQDAEVQGWIYHNSSDANKVSRALSLFKQDTGWGVNNNSGSQRNQGTQNLNASMSVDVPGDSANGDPRKHPKYIWTESEIAKMHPTVFAQFADDITLAMSERRVAMG